MIPGDTRNILISKGLLALFVAVSWLQFRAANAAQVREEYTCNPSSDCASRVPGNKVPDPVDCKNYYLCLMTGPGGNIFPSDSPISCPLNQHFDPALGDCAEDDGNECKDNCLNFCKTQCESDGDVIAYPGNCTKYYICQSGTPVEIDCPLAMYFNGINCTSDKNLCCDTCTPYCSINFIETMDPYDCERYFICTSAGIPDASDSFPCPDGKYFETSEGRCVIQQATPCKAICEDLPIFN